MTLPLALVTAPLGPGPIRLAAYIDARGGSLEEPQTATAEALRCKPGTVRAWAKALIADGRIEGTKRPSGLVEYRATWGLSLQSTKKTQVGIRPNEAPRSDPTWPHDSPQPGPTILPELVGGLGGGVRIHDQLAQATEGRGDDEAIPKEGHDTDGTMDADLRHGGREHRGERPAHRQPHAWGHAGTQPDGPDRPLAGGEGILRGELRAGRSDASPRELPGVADQSHLLAELHAEWLTYRATIPKADRWRAPWLTVSPGKRDFGERAAAHRDAFNAAVDADGWTTVLEVMRWCWAEGAADRLQPQILANAFLGWGARLQAYGERRAADSSLMLKSLGGRDLDTEEQAIFARVRAEGSMDDAAAAIFQHRRAP